jgi:DNA-binding XRE family transcriptional regulator
MDQDTEALRNYGIAMEQIRGILQLPRAASPHAIVAKVRETKSAADLAGAALEVREHYTPQITGTDIKIARIRKGLKAQDVAAVVGLSQSYYSEIENGVKPITSALFNFVRSNL